ncbi:MAG: YitT family protein, partial [Chloroflexia bacterium]
MAKQRKGSARRWVEFVRAYAVITLGVVLLALANDLFLIPNQVFSGGATGLALVINSFVPIPVGLLVLIINIPLVLAGLVWLGGLRFVARTAYAVVVYSILLDALAPYLKPVTSDPLLYTLY